MVTSKDRPASRPSPRRRSAAAVVAVTVTAVVALAAAAPATAIPAVSAVSAAAAPAALPAAAGTVPADHVTVTVGPNDAYRLDGDLTAGALTVQDDVVGMTTASVTGDGSLPGPAGGAAAVHLALTGLGPSGPVTLSDPTADLTVSLTVLGGLTRPTDGVVSWSGSGQVRRGSRTTTEAVTFTVADRHPDPGTYAVHLTHDGVERRALVRVPAAYTGAPLPVVVHFPGLLESPAIAEFYGHMSDFADAHGFIQVTAEHYGTGWQGVLGGPSSPELDDPGFIRELMATVVSRFDADPHRLYASGMSNGGFFTNLMACQTDNVFAAFVAVSGPLQDIAGCHPGGPVPIVEIHGTGDPIVPFSGAKPSADFWAANNGCRPTTTDTTLPDVDPNDGTRVIRHVYDGCPATAPVVFYEITGGGHNWPGESPFLPFNLTGGQTYDIDANVVIWDFVQQFTR